MRNKRIVIYGGTELDSLTSEYVTKLAFELLENDRILLATGGFGKPKQGPHKGTSTDLSVLRGAEAFVRERHLPLESVLETWVPEPTKDRGGVDRFKKGKVEILHGLSDQARRLRLVQVADALITVKGHIRTALLLEMALAIARPALPLAFTGGDSHTHWNENRSYYLSRLGVTEKQAHHWEALNLHKTSPAARSNSIRGIITAVTRVIRRNCLVLMPFKKRLDQYYSQLQRIIDDLGFHPVRLDRDLYAGDIRETVRQLLRESDAVIADITDRSANVMYEIGLAHAFGLEPLLLWRGGARKIERSLPFYLKPQRIAVAANSKTVAKVVKQYLRQNERVVDKTAN